MQLRPYGVQRYVSQHKDADMLTLKKPTKQYYSETEAAHSLCISIEALHGILDQHIFNSEHPRPALLEYTHAELLLLSIWAEPERDRNVLAMPSRN
jgi:hypothetical protein